MSDISCAACGALAFPGTATFDHKITCPVRRRTGKVERDTLDDLLDEPPLTQVMSWQLLTADVCKHNRVTVCDEGMERWVACTICDARLDPIAVLAEYAEQDRRLLSTLESVREARAKAADDHEQIRKATDALKRQRAAQIRRDPMLAELVKLRQDVARQLRAHPDEDVARMRAGIRDRLTMLIDATVKAIEAIT